MAQMRGSVGYAAEQALPFPPLREGPPPPERPPKLLDQVRLAIRARHFSPRTGKAYVAWIRRFILFHGKRHPLMMGEPEVSTFLSSLAQRGHVSASTQNQALCALLFLYRQVLDQNLARLEGVVRARPSRRLPTVLERDEVAAVLREMNGLPLLMALLMYGAGLRLLECARLRVMNVDFASSQIFVRGGKGNKDRRTILPESAKAPLQRHLVGRRRLGRAARRPRKEVPQCGARVDVAVGLPGDTPLPRRRNRPTAAPPPARDRDPARHQGRGQARRHHEARRLSLVAPLLRDRSPG